MLWRALELSLVQTATPHEAHPRYVLQTVPGLGHILSRGLRSAIHAIRRFPSAQALAAYARLVNYRNASAGKRLGTSGKNIGNAHLQWAFSEAATLVLRHHPSGQTLLSRWEQPQGQGTALPLLAHTLARAVSDMRTRNTAVAMDRFWCAYRSRAGEPGASRDTPGMRLNPARCSADLAASWHAQVGIGPVSQRPGV
jgi:hypothetical protein